MTLIIYKNWIVSADRKVSWGYNCNDKQDKIVKVDWNVIWIAWDTIPLRLVEQVYAIFKDTTWDLSTELNCIKFKELLETYAWIKEVSASMLIANKDLVLLLWGKNHIEYPKDWFMAMWSWHIIALSLEEYFTKQKIKPEMCDYFEVASALDDTISSDFDTIEV